MLASAVILGSSIVGCTGAGVEQRPSVSITRPQMLAPQIEKALADKQYDRALVGAEQLVAATPDDGGYRSLLGRAYLANGRYDSARAVFRDAMTLGNRDVRTIVSLSLVETGLGDAQAARSLLAKHISDLPAADYGLAMAMAGNAEEGVRALVEATRQPEATMQTRQNLAYALALGGAWGQARLIAGQDLSARDAEQRIGEWSRGGTGQQRVIAMLGVAPRNDDAGMPVQLALRSGADEPSAVQAAAAVDLVAQARADAGAAMAPAAAETQLAAAHVVAETIGTSALVEAGAALETIDIPAAQAAQAAPVTVAQAAQAIIAPAMPVLRSVDATALAPSPDAPSLAAIFADDDTARVSQVSGASDPLRGAARAAFQRSAGIVVPATTRRPAAPVAAAIVVRPSATDWVVQLGAFNSAAIAHEKWRQISSRQPRLGGFGEVFSEINVNGRVFHRLAIRGFGDRNMASATCRSLSAVGQACFVRLDDRADNRMAGGPAHKGGQQVATR